MIEITSPYGVVARNGGNQLALAVVDHIDRDGMGALVVGPAIL